jgi:hypothetical protein
VDVESYSRHICCVTLALTAALLSYHMRRLKENETWSGCLTSMSDILQVRLLTSWVTGLFWTESLMYLFTRVYWLRKNSYCWAGQFQGPLLRFNA